MLSKLVYISVRSTDCSEEEIKNILASCIKNNGELDITGVLLYTDLKFIQCLEGERLKILELYDKIKTDTRHKNVVMISLGLLKERAFPTWQMGCKKISLNDIEFNTQMSTSEKNEFKAILAGEKESSEKVIELINKIF